MGAALCSVMGACGGGATALGQPVGEPIEPADDVALVLAGHEPGVEHLVPADQGRGARPTVCWMRSAIASLGTCWPVRNEAEEVGRRRMVQAAPHLWQRRRPQWLARAGGIYADLGEGDVSVGGGDADAGRRGSMDAAGGNVDAGGHGVDVERGKSDVGGIDGGAGGAA